MGSGCAIGTVTSAAAGCRDMALPSLTKDPKLERAVRMQDGPAVVIGAELLQYAGDVDVRSAATGAFERGGARLPIPGDGGAGRRVRRAQDRESVGVGKSGSVRVGYGGRRIIKKN